MSRSSRFSIIVIPVLLLLYMVIRVPLLEQQAIGNDEKRDVGMVEHSLEQDQMIYHGARFTHKGHIPSPIYYNLLTWGYTLTDSLLGMRWMVLLFNFVGIAALLYFIRGLFSLRITILFGIFVAVSPWLVKYGTFSWNPNYLPLVAAGYLICGYKTLTTERSPWILPAFLFLFLGISMHIITLPYIIAFLGMLFLLPRKINWGYGAIAGLMIMAFLAIYLYYDYQREWWNTQLLFLSEDDWPYKWESFKVLQYLLLFTTTEMSYFIKRGFTYNVQYWSPFYQAVMFLIALIGSAFITLAAHYRFVGEQWRTVKRIGFREYLSQYPFTSFIAVNVSVLILFAIVLGRGFEPRYGLIAVYYLILIIIFTVDKFLTLSEQKSKALYYVCLIGWGLFMVYNLYLSLRISLPHPLNHIFY